jgi:adenine-specific DNA-methyltransferase
MVVVNKMESSRDKVRRLLRDLFQFDAQDLDFGIYRILNFRRKEIERFIEKDLIEAVEAEFKEYARAGMVELQKEVERLKAEIIRDFGEGTIDAQGHVMKHEDAPKIKDYIKKVEEFKSAEVSEAQMNEVFNHVYEFFSRYYDKGDFISKRRYGGKEKYYVPYNGEEAVLHWANKDQYYVKTAEYFRSYTFRAGAYRVNFLLREADVEVNNVVGENKYFVLCNSDFVNVDEEKKTVDVYFEYRALTDEEKRKLGKRNVQELLVADGLDRIFSELGGSSVGGQLRVKVDGERTVLEKHLNLYVKRNTTDYFIHKNLKAFLERELEFYIKNEVVDLDELENLDERSLRIAKAKVKAIRGISKKIIEFLAQIEDFQKMLFEKKKFIIGTEYVITLDKIKEYAGEDFLESILERALKNTEQLREWKELLGIKVKSKKDLIGKQTIDGKEWKKLPIDTKHFDQEFKMRLVEKLSDKSGLDEILDGTLIKSENLQALNILLEKFKGRVMCIYIDPPFNTGNDEFLYKDNYQHSSWLTMMSDRLELARKMLNSKGTIYVHCDYNENSRLKLLLDEIFGSNSFLNEVIYAYRIQGIAQNFWARKHQTLYFYNRSDNYQFNSEKEIVPYEKPFIDTISKEPDFDLTTRERQNLKTLIDEGKPFPDKYKDALFRKYYSEVFVRDVWDHDYTKPFISGSKEYLAFRTQKSEGLLKRIISSSSRTGEVIMDFFLGSGTTVAVAHKLHRKWIGIELENYFENIVMSRIKEVLAGFGKHEPIGISESIDWKGGGFFKYHYVEQYEDTLNNIVFRDKDKTIQETLESFQDYFLRYMLDYETRDSPTRLNIEQFQTPFDYKIWVTTAGEKRLATVDLVETFNYLLGITVEKFRTFKNQEQEYRCIFGKLNQENIAIIWRNTKNIDLKKDKEFIEKTILAETKPDRIFTNGDSIVEKAEPIEPEFKRLMGA